MISRKIFGLLIIFFACANFELVHSMERLTKMRTQVQKLSPEERLQKIDELQRSIERLKSLRGGRARGSEMLEKHIRELQEKKAKL